MHRLRRNQHHHVIAAHGETDLGPELALADTRFAVVGWPTEAASQPNQHRRERHAVASAERERLGGAARRVLIIAEAEAPRRLGGERVDERSHPRLAALSLPHRLPGERDGLVTHL